MRAAVYTRFSSDRQSELSTQAQIRACREYAESNGIEIVHVYSDEAISGTEEKTVPDCFEAFPLHIRQHFLEKWNALYESYGSRAVLAAFFNELSDTYRIPLMEWVLEHYGKFVDKSRFGEEE